MQLNVAERPTGIAIDGSDNLYIFPGVTGRIWKFVLGGSEPASFPDLQLVATVPGRSATNRGDNMTLGPGGDLFAVSNLDMYRVGPDGTTELFVSGLDGPFNSVSTSTNRDLLVTEFADSTAAGRAFRIRPARRLIVQKQESPCRQPARQGLSFTAPLSRRGLYDPRHKRP